jgi:hypothetical protein
VEAIPTPEGSETADKLKEHTSARDAICGIVEKPIREIPKSTLDNFLNTLEKYNGDMPSKKWWTLDNLKVKVLGVSLGHPTRGRKTARAGRGMGGGGDPRAQPLACVCKPWPCPEGGRPLEEA